MNNNGSKDFLEELRSLDESTKKRMLVIGTVLIMLIVVGVWFSYFNNIIAANAPQAVADNDTSTPATAPVQIAVGDTTAPPATGSSIWQDVKNEMASIGNIFKGPSQYTIQPN